MTKFDFPAGLCKVFAAHMMKFFSKALLTALLLAAIPLPRLAQAATSPDSGQVALAVARWLEQAHYTRHKLDKEMSAKLLTTYLEALDYNKLYFTQQDVDEFTNKYANSLDDAIFRGDLSPAHEIFARFKERLEARVASNKKLVEKKWNFSGFDSV